MTVKKITPTGPRKIVQIASGADLSVFALCDDGSLWRYYYSEGAEEWRWSRLEPIPQK